MKASTGTDIGRIRYQGKRIEKQEHFPKTLKCNLESSGSRTELSGHWSAPNETKHAHFSISDTDGKENLRVQFRRHRDTVSLSVGNPGNKGEKTGVSIPLGQLGETKEMFFSKGFFPTTGISQVDLRVEKDDEGQYSRLEVRRGKDTQPQAYRVDDGKIYEVPMDVGFRGYLDLYG